MKDTPVGHVFGQISDLSSDYAFDILAKRRTPLPRCDVFVTTIQPGPVPVTTCPHPRSLPDTEYASMIDMLGKLRPIVVLLCLTGKLSGKITDDPTTTAPWHSAIMTDFESMNYNVALLPVTLAKLGVPLALGPRYYAVATPAPDPGRVGIFLLAV